MPNQKIITLFYKLPKLKLNEANKNKINLNYSQNTSHSNTIN